MEKITEQTSTGNVCKTPGKYKCADHPYCTANFQNGDRFTPCKTWSHETTWVLVKTA